MATKDRRVTERVSYVFLQKLTAAVALVAFVVVIAAGVMGEARVITITFRAAVVLVAIGIVSRIVIRILASYEEMNSGKT